MNSTYWINSIMSTAYTNSSGQFWLGLSSTLPVAGGTGVSEPSGGAYSRVQILAFSQPSNGMVKNTAALSFPQSTATWFDSDHKARYWVLFDGSGSGAHLLSAGLLDEARTIESNTTVTIAAESLKITLSDYQTVT